VPDDEESEAHGRIHVRSTDGTVSLDQHADKEPGEQTSVRGVRLVVSGIVRDHAEGDEEDEGQGGHALGNDLPPESGGLDFLQGALRRTTLHGSVGMGRRTLDSVERT